jgi:hypothetical protein
MSGAHLVFGLSSGAVIVLEALRVLPSIRKVALYEPPFYLGGMPTDMVARFDNEVSRGKLAAALVTASRIVGLGPPLLNVLPRPLLELGTAMFLQGEDKKKMSGKIESFASVKADVLLLGGSRSPKYLKKALDALEQIVPRVGRVEFEDLDHSAAWNHDRGGTPEVVGESWRRFFKE